MVPAISAGRLSQRNESRVAEAGQAAVFLNADVDAEAFIRIPEFQRNKTPNSLLIPDLISAFSKEFHPLTTV